MAKKPERKRHGGKRDGAGRPRFGVEKMVIVPVTVAPEHRDWLDAQEGGRSAAVRRLIDAATGSNPSA